MVKLIAIETAARNALPLVSALLAGLSAAVVWTFFYGGAVTDVIWPFPLVTGDGDGIAELSYFGLVVQWCSLVLPALAAFIGTKRLLRTAA